MKNLYTWLKLTVALITFINLLNLPPANGQSYVYWTSSGKIHRSFLDGTGHEVVVHPLNPLDIALDLSEAKMYWVERSSAELPARIGQANLDGSQMETVLEFPQIEGFAFDAVNRKLYWGDGHNGWVSRYVLF